MRSSFQTKLPGRKIAEKAQDQASTDADSADRPSVHVDSGPKFGHKSIPWTVHVMDRFGRRTMIIYDIWTEADGRTDGLSMSWTNSDDRP